MKRLLSLMMAVMVLCTCFSMPAAAAGEAVITEIEFGSLEMKPEFNSSITEYKVYMEDSEIPLPKYKVSDGDSSVITTQAQKIGETTVITVTSPSGDAENVYKFKFVGKRLTENEAKSWDPVVMSNQVSYYSDIHYTASYAPNGYLNLSGKNGGMYTSGNVWAFIRIALKDIPENADKLKIHLVSVASFKTELKNYEWTIGIYDAPGVKADWKFTETPSQMAANGNKTSLLGVRIGEITQDDLVIDGSKYIVGGDITDYLLKKKADGVAETTICLSMETTNHPNTMRAVFTPYQSGTVANRPYLSWVTYPADRNNNLKSVVFENGAMAEKLSEDKNAYSVAKFGDSNLIAKYITDSPFASVKEEISENGVITATVTAESGETNVYTFTPVSAEDAGFTANGKLEIVKNDEGTANYVIDVDRADVSVNAEVKNASQTTKTVYMVVNVVKNGKLIDRAVVEEGLVPGYHNLTSEFKASDEDITVSSYIADGNEFVPEGIIVTAGEEVNEIAKSDDFTVSYEDLAIDVVTVSGKAKANAPVVIGLVKEGYDIDDYDATNFDEVFAYTNAVTADKDGYYSAKINLNGESEEDYQVYVNTAKQGEFTFENLSSRENIVAGIIDADDLKTALDLSNPENDLAVKFMIDTNFTEYGAEDEFVEILDGFIDDRAIDSSMVSEFGEACNDAITLVELNNGKTEDISALEKAALNEDVMGYYQLMDDDDKLTVLKDGMSGNDFKKFEEINPVFEEKAMLTFIAEYDNNDKVAELIGKFATELGLDSYIGDFDDLNSIKKNKVIDALKDAAPYEDVSDLEDPFKKAVKDNKPDKEGGSTGGNGGSASGGIGIKQEITTTKDTEVKDIPADNFVPARAYKFVDMKDHAWAEGAVKALYEGYVIDGVSETEFNPAGQVKREEFIKMINTLYEGQEVTSQFADMDMTAWYVPFINKAVGSGVIKGISEDTFGIGNGVTRQDMAVILYRVLKGVKADAEAFADDSDISEYAKDAVYYLRSKGIISGTDSGNYEPLRIMTRAEAAVVVNNILKLQNK